jgi:hypothetical protein
MSSTFFKTYDQVGIKEDISDVITNISPTKTPFQSLLKSERVNNRLFQWQEDSLAAVGDNAQLEGFTASDSTMNATTMRSNYTQILAKTVNVSTTADTVSTYGRAKETAYQLAKKADELKRELEYHLVGKTQNASAGADGSTARTFANVFGTDSASAAVIHADVTVTTDSDGDTGGNQAGPLTEDNLLAVNQKMYEAGSEGKYIMVKPADAITIAGFAKAAGRYREIETGSAADRTLVNVIDLYVSPFGEQKVIINRFLKASEALVFDPAMWSLVTLRPWTRELLAKTGDSDRHLIVGEFSLKHKNYKATGRITNLSGTNPTLP